MAKLLTGVPVFIALLCGQPDLLVVLCVYLLFTILLGTAVAAVLGAG